MGLEDIAMFGAEPNLILYPSDATTTWAATILAAEYVGPTYIRFTIQIQPLFIDQRRSFTSAKQRSS